MVAFRPHRASARHAQFQPLGPHLLDGYIKAGKRAEAEPLLLAGYEGLQSRESTIPPEAAARLQDALNRLIDLHTATDNPEEAEKFRDLRESHDDPAAPPPES